MSIIPKKELEQINELKLGKIRGEALRTDIKYIENLKGKKEAENIKKEMLKIEPEFDYNNIKGMSWYPAKWRLLSLSLIKNYFNWKEEDLIKMGDAAPSNSFIVKIISHYFVSLEKACRKAPVYWEKHYSMGKLEIAEFSTKKKKVIYELRNFKGHPDLCTFLKGYFRAMIEMMLKDSIVKVEETRCPYKGDKYHRFEVTWQNR